MTPLVFTWRFLPRPLSTLIWYGERQFRKRLPITCSKTRINPYRPEVGADWGVGEPGGSEVTSGCCGFFAQPRNRTSMNMINIRVACRLLWAFDGDMVVVRTVDLFLDSGVVRRADDPHLRRSRSPQCTKPASLRRASPASRLRRSVACVVSATWKGDSRSAAFIPEQEALRRRPLRRSCEYTLHVSPHLLGENHFPHL